MFSNGEAVSALKILISSNVYICPLLNVSYQKGIVSNVKPLLSVLYSFVNLKIIIKVINGLINKMEDKCAEKGV